jgi:hypothetical protein
MTCVDFCKNNIPIYFDEESREIVYKENRVSYDKLKEAVESGFDRVYLKKDLYLRHFTNIGVFEFGCLVLTEEKVQQLNKKVWKLLKT